MVLKAALKSRRNKMKRTLESAAVRLLVFVLLQQFLCYGKDKDQTGFVHKDSNLLNDYGVEQQQLFQAPG